MHKKYSHLKIASAIIIPSVIISSTFIVTSIQKKSPFTQTVSPQTFSSSTVSLSQLTFINPALLNTDLKYQNVENIFNKNGHSFLYAHKKTNGNANVIDTVALIQDSTNQMKWAVDAEKIKEIIKNYRNQKKPSTPPSHNLENVKINKAEYSISSRSYYLNVYVYETDETKGHTVILKISESSGDVSVYFDAALATESKMTGSQSRKYVNTNFSQFVIKTDNQSTPTLILIKGDYEKATSGTNQTIAIEVTGSTGGSVGDVTGRNVFETSFITQENTYLNTTGNKIYATNSAWINGGLFLLLQKRNSAGNTTEVVAYAYSTRGNGFNAPFRTSIKKLPGNDTHYSITAIKGQNYLVARQNKAAPTTGNFADSGPLLVQKLDLTINGNNANATVTNDQKQIKYFNNGSLLGISNVYSTTKISSNAEFVAISNNNVLVTLDRNLNFIDQLALVDLPSNVSIIDLKTVGINYFLYLSNGEIWAYNNSGFAGTPKTLASNGLEKPVSISFKDQSQVNNGAAIFADSLNKFKQSFEANLNSFLNIQRAYNNVSPVLEFETVDKEVADQKHSHESTIKIYQVLRTLDANGTVNPSGNIIGGNKIRVFLGEKTFRFFLNNPDVKTKSFVSLPEVLRRSLPSQIASMYANNNDVYNLFLDVKNIDLYDKAGNGSNISVRLTPNDKTGRLTINFNVTYLHENGKLTNRNFSSTISGFPTSQVENSTLTFNINPFSKDILSEKFGKILPSQIKPSEVLDNFIILSPFLKQSDYELSILPQNAKGKALFKLKFNFKNNLVSLSQEADAAKKALQVTHDSIVWESEEVFKSNTAQNQNILIKFNTFDEIKAKNPSIVLQKPSQVKTAIENAGNTQQKLNAIIGYNFVTMSDYVKDKVANIIISNINDLTGEFTLQLNFNNPLGNSLRTTFPHDFSGFQTDEATANDVYNITFLTKEQYLATNNVSEQSNIFNRSASDVEISDLMIRQSGQLSPNGVLGGLINFSDNALNSQYNITLTPENATGKLLITIVFNSFIELGDDGRIKNISNKKIVHYYDGFNKTNENGIFFLNWYTENEIAQKKLPNSASASSSSSNSTSNNFSEFTSVEFAGFLRNLEPLELLQFFGQLSDAALKKYRNDPNQFQVQITPNADRGSLNVRATFNEWNNTNGITEFSQTFTGFKLPIEVFQTQIGTYDPTNSQFLDRAVIEVSKVNNLPSEMTPEMLNKFFTFQDNILNNLEKKIYFLYDDSTGSGKFVFFIKRPSNLVPENSDTNNTETNLTTTAAIRSFNNVQTIAAPNIFDDEVETHDFQISRLIPISELVAEGYVLMTNPLQNVTGFKIYKPEEKRFESIVNLSLAIGLPIIIFLPLIIILFAIRQKPIILFVQSKIINSLFKKRKLDKKRETIEEDE
ncbi:hypothetical protein NV226_01125 [Mycoplasma iguanae]|uniref:Uncharacterized protein n=1 Tax=Mycoplasma iguanae TaxID=292461 RepID=A0ABY5R8Q4_9MOLU|nr:hypothetical protein [Mycoplasma iguanae]UVD81891.1 hypothetical protein NV226_01125 [Mycoplasma iguanae]